MDYLETKALLQHSLKTLEILQKHQIYVDELKPNNIFYDYIYNADNSDHNNTNKNVK